MAPRSRALPAPPSYPPVIALALVWFLSACGAGGPPLARELVDEPWRATRRGSWGPLLELGLRTGYEVDSEVEVVDANFGEPAFLHGDLEGLFGAGLGLEYFVLDDVSLVAGAELRQFEPHIEDDVFQFDKISQVEYSLGLRYVLPMRLLRGGRLRPYLQTKLAYIPKVEYDMTTLFELPDPLDDVVLVSPYRGSSYTTLAAGAGLTYQLRDDLIGRLGFFYEWAQSRSTDRVPSLRRNSSGNDFIDDTLDLIEFDIDLEPEGWVAFLGFTYFP